MIQYENQRTRGSEVFPPITNTRTLVGALEMLVIYEIGYGGKIVSAEKDSLMVKTRVLGCVDTTTFSGPADEFKLLLEAAAIADYFDPWKDEAAVDSLVDRVMQVTKGNPMLIKMSAGLIEGQSTARKVLLALLEDEDLVSACIASNPSMKDLLALVSLTRIDKVSAKEALSLLQ